MDSNISIENPIVQGVISGFIYDVFSIVVAFFIFKVLYEKLYMNWKWGSWNVQIIDKTGNLVVDRKLSIQATKRILEDKGEFSIYVKGIVSPYDFINTDIASEEAERLGLISRDDKGKNIIVDLSKNPPKK